MGQKHTCHNCGEEFDTERIPNPYGIEKESFNCPNCNAMNNVVFNPFE